VTLKIIRVLFVLACIAMGTVWADYLVAFEYENAEDAIELAPSTQTLWRLLGGMLGGLAAGFVLVALLFVTQDLFERLAPVFIALSFSMMLGYFFARYLMLYLPPDDLRLHFFLTSSLVLLFGFAGISLGMTMSSNWQSLVTAVKRQTIQYGNPKLIDTSVIIDGRIADVVTTGFLEGTLIVPRFILKELQNIADSADDLRRAKGRRGLDILKAMQEGEHAVQIEVIDDDPVDVKHVDGKLMALARDLNAKVVTNDFNLNKVAQIEGIEVLNLNDLANSLKPSVLPDEKFEVKIVKEGKEATQGVGFLDDGTMIVVDGGRVHLGKKVSVVVTSVLQTAAGRMIFTKLGSVAP
jgi:uncharacterized protein YacL